MSKRIYKVLKGVAITGATVGGASVFGDANLAFAHELEEVTQSSSGELTIEVTSEVVQEAAQEIVQEAVVEAASIQAAPVQAAPVEVTPVQEAPQVEAPVEENPTQEVPQAETPAQDNPTQENPAQENPVQEIPQGEAPAQEAPAEQPAFDPTVYTTSESAEEAKAEAETELATAQQNMAAEQQTKADAETELGQAENEKEQAESQLNQVKNEYTEAGYDHEGLDKEQEEVAKKIIAEADARKAVVVNPNSTYLTVANYYKPAGRPLAKELIKYTLIQTGEVSAENIDKVVFGEWFDNNDYEDKHYCVRYINSKGELVEKYFDYVTCDKDGKSMIRKDENDHSNDVAENVYGINVLIKTPTYKYYDAEEGNTSFKAYEATAENKQLFAKALKNKTMKIVTVDGKDFIVPQRDGWYAPNGESHKGTDYYGMTQYAEDVQNRSDLNDKIADLNQKISDLTDKINGLKDKISDAEGNIAVIQKQIDNLENTIDALEDRIEELKIAEKAKPSASSDTYYYAPQQQSVEIVANSALPVDNVVTKPTAGAELVNDIEESLLEQVINQAPAIPPVEVEAIEDVQVPLAVVDLEAPEDEVQSVTIEDAEVAKAADDIMISRKWNGATLPTLGTLAGFFAISKLRKDSKESK